jgi:protein SCO1/2
MNKYIYIFLLTIVFGCKGKTNQSSLPFINKPDFTPEWIRSSSEDYKKIHQIPPFSFTDQDGNTITEKTVEGKIYVANFMFTRCASICPKMATNLLMVQEKFKSDDNVLIFSHSVTPDLDSVSVLKKYANAHNIISAKWFLLTGKQEEIYRLARKEYYAGNIIGYYQKGNEFLHTENVILLDNHRRIRGIYNGTLPIEMNRLIEDIETLKLENY